MKQWIRAPSKQEIFLNPWDVLQRAKSKQKLCHIFQQLFCAGCVFAVSFPPWSGELKFLINYQLCLLSEDCWNVSLWWHCVVRHFLIQTIRWFLSVLPEDKSCSSTALIIIHRFVSVDLVCYRSTLGLGHKFQIHACHKIKEGPLCMGCLFVLIGILLIYFKISRGIQTIKKQKGDQHGLNVVPLDPPSILNCLTIRL